MNGYEIMKVKNTRFLGIWIDDALKFDKQLQVITKKLEDSVKTLICVKDSLNYRVLINNKLYV